MTLVNTNLPNIDDIVEKVIRTTQHVPEPRKGEDSLPDSPYKVYNTSNNPPKNLLDFVTILRERLINTRAFPTDYNFEEHKALFLVQLRNIPADTSPLEQKFGFKPTSQQKADLRNFAKGYVRYYTNFVTQFN